ncbi:hypothetical protein FNAPI_9595 [Fusarium napiforme]|uniref:Uncharacterized protein n=1 Tax=Fusarium napiforme TaxID=42672 RepID=A0A8H5IXG8_9HYPO|nr:hypothetical protein FNAPI_9595 [Fusarium napiforme]
MRITSKPEVGTCLSSCLQSKFCRSFVPITTITIITITMPARLPDVSGLLALLDRFRTPKRSGLPGGAATEEKIAFVEKDSPTKGERIAPGPWPDSSSSPSSSSSPPSPSLPPLPPPSSASSPPPQRLGKRKRWLRLFSSSSSS